MEIIVIQKSITNFVDKFYRYLNSVLGVYTADKRIENESYVRVHTHARRYSAYRYLYEMSFIKKQSRLACVLKPATIKIADRIGGNKYLHTRLDAYAYSKRHVAIALSRRTPPNASFFCFLYTRSAVRL